MSAEEFTGFATPQTAKSEYSTLAFICQQLINKTATVMPVLVVACTNSGGLVPAGTVDIQPLVDQITGARQTFPHGVIFRVPYFRLQGGPSTAIIIDPAPGDIGAALFCMRDISALKADPTAALTRVPSAGAPPGSLRVYDWADALYLGGFLNPDTVTQYARFSAAGIELVSPTRVRLQAPAIELIGPVTASSTVDAAGVIHSDVDVVSDTISGKTHTHGGVAVGGANTAVPNP